MIHVVQLFGAVFGFVVVWFVWKILEIREQKIVQKEVEEVRKQYNK